MTRRGPFRKGLPLFLLAWAGLSLAPSPALACTLPQAPLHYQVFNEKDPIGGIWIDFHHEGTRTRVETLIKAKARFLLIPVLDYRHQSEEIWEADALRRFEGKTTDNGRRYDVTVEPNGHGFKARTNGEMAEVEAPLLSQAVWCEKALHGNRIFSPLKGRLKEVKVRYLGEEQVRTGRGTTLARTYEVTQMRKGKPVLGKLWYGADGIVVLATFPSKQNTPITFALQ